MKRKRWGVPRNVVQREHVRSMGADKRIVAKYRKGTISFVRDVPIEKLLKSVSKKSLRLKFCSITDACEGHFFRGKDMFSGRVALSKVNPNEKVQYTGEAYFEIMLNNSPPARHFRAALKALASKMPFAEVSGGGRIIEVGTYFPVSGAISKREAQKIENANKRFFKEVEKLVDRFVVKYGVKGRVLHEH